MKIYGHFMSAPANQVRLTASALNLDFDYQHVDLMQGAHKSPEYLAVNAFGRVPAMDDDGFKLAESSAISRYLACKTDCDLYPNNSKARGEIDQWMDYAAHHVRANVSKVLFNKIFAPMMDMPVDEQSMKDGRQFLDNALPIVNEALGKHSYLTGDKMTIADTAMIAALEPAETIEYDVSPHANIKKWRDGIMGQDFYKRVHNHYAEEMNAQ